MAARSDLTPPDEQGRGQQIVDVLVDAFAHLMAAGPCAFYRGSACLFYADMATTEHPAG